MYKGFSTLYGMLLLSTYEIGYCPVGGGCRIHRLQKGKTLPMNVLDMILNNPMMRFQQCWSFEEYEVPLHCHCSQVHSGSGVAVPDRVLSMGWIELNCVLMLNWIALNRIVLTFKLCTCVQLNCLKCNWFFLIRTVWLYWITWNRKFFDN